MNLSTEYLGLRLPHPLVAGASPLADDLDGVKRLEDAGAAAIVLRSLFEEQITREQMAELFNLDNPGESFAEAASYFPSPHAFALGPFQYLEHLRRVKEAVRIPVIASLNGATPGGWLGYARLMAEAGADALELNLYRIATDPGTTSADIERQAIDTVREVKKAVSIPVAVKLSPFYTALAHVARELDRAGADGLVLFNRFYQPDIDIKTMTPLVDVALSDSSELRLRLQWLAILHGRVKPSLAVSGGVATPDDGIKSILAGADAVQIVSALLRHGPTHVQAMRRALERWMAWNHFDRLDEARGRASLDRVADAETFERAQYIRTLHSWPA